MVGGIDKFILGLNPYIAIAFGYALGAIVMSAIWEGRLRDR